MYAHLEKLSPSQWPVQRPELTKVEREMMNGRLPWWRESNALCVAFSSMMPQRLWTSSST